MCKFALRIVNNKRKIIYGNEKNISTFEQKESK
jgi:hypothetical protein